MSFLFSLLSFMKYLLKSAGLESVLEKKKFWSSASTAWVLEKNSLPVA